VFVEILLSVLFGIFLGFITGLIPGIHPNTVFVIIISLSTIFLISSNPVLFVFIISLSISNTFFDFIPSILFGAPEEDNTLSILPAHRMLLEGRGYDALFLVTIGGLGVMFLTIISLPFLFFFLPSLYFTTRPVIHMILIFVVLWMVYTEKKRLTALFLFILSGLFGFITLSSFPSSITIFPALTGLFGISTLVTSIVHRTKIPTQKVANEVHADWLKGSLTGWIAGLFSGLLPGLGSSQTGVLAAQMLKTKMKEFLIALGGINTANIFFTFLLFYFTGKIRSGAIWAISQITDELTLNDVYMLVIVAIFTSLISAVLTIKIGKYFLRKMKIIDYTKFASFIIISLIFLVILFSGFVGLLIAITGTFLGLFTIYSGVRRTHLMGFLVLPTILYFSGLNPILINILWS